jgi:hypothetical protein
MNAGLLVMRVLCGVCLLAFGCSTTEQSSKGTEEVAASVMEVPVIPDEPVAVQGSSSSEASGEVQERGVTRLAPGALGDRVTVLGTLSTGATGVYPGEFAIRTQKGYYLTAINGGGRPTDPTVITAATSAGPWEKFKLAIATPPSPHDKTLQTATGNFVTAVNGGGMTANALHTDATQAKDWERFRLIDLGVGTPSSHTYYGIQTIKGNYLTATGAGGKYQDALHTDATQVKGWEQFRIVKCGDLGSGQEYGVMAANGSFFSARSGGGQTTEAILLGYPTGFETKFKFINQGDGTYALQTANGRNYVTAVGGGGQVQKYNTPDCGMFSACIGGFSTVFHTDATQVRAWEKFRLIDQGNCTYAIQTSSGFFVGIYKDSAGRTLLTTRRDGAPTVNEKFQFVVYGLASPAILK